VAGTWETDKLTESQVVRAFIAAGSSESVGHAFFSQLGQPYSGGVTHNYAVITLVFKDGLTTELESGDGGAALEGSSGTYAIGSNSKISLTSGSCTGTYRFEVSDHTLRLNLVQQCADPDGIFGTVIASFPFHR
jgi:hypothetical protein